MIKIFTYLDEGCEACKYALNNLKKIENWKNYFEIIDICVDSSKEVKTDEEKSFSSQSLQYGITEGPTIVLVDGESFTIVKMNPYDMTEEYFKSLINV